MCTVAQNIHLLPSISTTLSMFPLTGEKTDAQRTVDAATLGQGDLEEEDGGVPSILPGNSVIRGIWAPSSGINSPRPGGTGLLGILGPGSESALALM